MHYLYGSKKGVERRLVATFGSEQQLLAYVRWATLKELGEQRGKFEHRQRARELRGVGAFHRAAYWRGRQRGRIQPLTKHAVRTRAGTRVG